MEGLSEDRFHRHQHVFEKHEAVTLHVTRFALHDLHLNNPRV